MTPPVVPWVVGAKLGLARGIAIVICRERGRAWDRMTPGQRDAAMAEASEIVEEMVRAGTLASFPHEWRDPTVRKT